MVHAFKILHQSQPSILKDAVKRFYVFSLVAVVLLGFTAISPHRQAGLETFQPGYEWELALSPFPGDGRALGGGLRQYPEMGGY